MVSERMILNDSFQEAFANDSAPTSGFLSRLKNRFFPPAPEAVDLAADLSRLPFFRSLKPGVFEAFKNAARVIPAASGTFVCRTGARQRNLYVLLRGEASVRKGIRLATLTDGAVFGEVGFLS